MVEDKFLISRFIKKFEKIKMPPANTDNMGKLLVTLFAFAPARKTNL